MLALPRYQPVPAVGWTVLVGVLVGVFVGEFVGVEVGVRVGLLVGELVGVAVGWGVAVGAAAFSTNFAAFSIGEVYHAGPCFAIYFLSIAYLTMIADSDTLPR